MLGLLILGIRQACGSALSTIYHMGRMTARESCTCKALCETDRDPISRVQGKRYFTCPPSRGAFVRPDRVTVGSFPPEDLDLDDDEEI